MNQPTLQTTSDRASVRVLVADDSLINRLLARKLLSQAGYRADVVDNGQQAIDSLLAGDIFDLVLMDCQMPVMDGLEATRRIRELQSDGQLAKHIPIVAVSGLDFENVDEELPDGMDGYLVKPYEENELLQIVEAYTQPDTSPESEKISKADAISRHALMDICGGEHDIAVDLLQTFVDDGDACLARMRDGIQETDIEKVNAAGHSLKGASSMLTATAVSELSKQIENSEQLSELQQLVDQLDAEFEHCRRFEL